MSEGPADEDVAGEIIGRLAGDSEVELVDEGSFDIDASRGLAKLGQYQLAEPGAWILRAIEAGVRAGADRITVDTKFAGVDIEFERRAGPIVLPGSVLDRLLSVLVSAKALPPDASVDREVLVQLAIATNAVLGRGVSKVCIESVASDGRGVRLVCEVGGQRLEAVEEGRVGLRFEVAWPIAQGDVFNSLGLSNEARILRERCFWAPVPVLVDGFKVSQGLVLPQAWASTPILDEQGRTIGQLGRVDEDSPARVLLLAAGVAIESLALPELPNAVLGVLEAGDLARDLSRSRFARGPELEARRARALAAFGELPGQVVAASRKLARAGAPPGMREGEALRGLGFVMFAAGMAGFVVGAGTNLELPAILGFFSLLFSAVPLLVGRARIRHAEREQQRRQLELPRASQAFPGRGMQQRHALPPAQEPPSGHGGAPHAGPGAGVQ